MTQNQDNIEEFSLNETNEKEEIHDPFDRLMFGNRSRRSSVPIRMEKHKEIEKNNVDYGHLLKQVDDIMTSINNIKPAFKQLSPLLDYFRKK
ncbi:hypothetical protein ACLM5H_01525 [Fredinandcohnia humi]